MEGSVCDSETGACVCKLNVEGMQCDRLGGSFLFHFS